MIVKCLLIMSRAFESPPRQHTHIYNMIYLSVKVFLSRVLIEFRCVVTVSTPAVWLARENIKRLTPRPCINVEYSHGVVYTENTT